MGLGYPKENLLLVRIDGLTAGYQDARLASLYHDIKARLYGLSSFDPMTIVVAIGVLGAVALISGYIPAARASRVNPVIALRHD